MLWPYTSDMRTIGEAEGEKLVVFTNLVVKKNVSTLKWTTTRIKKCLEELEEWNFLKIFKKGRDILTWHMDYRRNDKQKIQKAVTIPYLLIPIAVDRRDRFYYQTCFLKLLFRVIKLHKMMLSVLLPVCLFCQFITSFQIIITITTLLTV